MYNLRYHIASLVAVFLALAVGLLLGTLVAERGMITDQAGALVADLQARFDDITAENDALEVGLERDRSFAEAAVGPLVGGQLAGRTVAVLVGTGRVDGAGVSAETIASAGGASFTVTIEKTALGLLEEEPAGLAGYFQLHGIEMASPGEDLVRQVADALVAEWRSGGPQPLTGILVGEGLIGIESAGATVTVDAVLAIDGAEGGGDPFTLAMARAMIAAGGTALGAESEAAPDGVSARFANEGLPAVDHVESPQGRVSLVWILAGRANGYYGSGDGAVAFYPPLEP